MQCRDSKKKKLFNFSLRIKFLVILSRNTSVPTALTKSRPWKVTFTYNFLSDLGKGSKYIMDKFEPSSFIPKGELNRKINTLAIAEVKINTLSLFLVNYNLLISLPPQAPFSYAQFLFVANPLKNHLMKQKKKNFFFFILF